MERQAYGQKYTLCTVVAENHYFNLVVLIIFTLYPIAFHNSEAEFIINAIGRRSMDSGHILLRKFSGNALMLEIT